MVIGRKPKHTSGKEGVVERQQERNEVTWVLFKNENLAWFFGQWTGALEKGVLEDMVTIFKINRGESLWAGSYHSWKQGGNIYTRYYWGILLIFLSLNIANESANNKEMKE